MAENAPKIVLEKGKKEINLAGKTFLEDFYEQPGNEPQYELEKLTLSVSFENGSVERAWQFYTRAVTNLKMSAPSLKVIALDGGYVFNPEADTTSKFEEEIYHLREHLNLLVKTLKNAGIKVEPIRFVAIYTFQEISIHTAPTVFRNVFNVELDPKQVEDKIVDFKYFVDDVEVKLKLSLSITLLKASERDRSRFYDAEVSIFQ
uniref:SEA domain-containing protein n=1 Tax=Bursaphelenchus xylophilus TaxID=6326 RepID=A0A1I7S7S9_BURXY